MKRVGVGVAVGVAVRVEVCDYISLSKLNILNTFINFQEPSFPFVSSLAEMYAFSHL